MGASGKNGEALEKNWKALENICIGIEKYLHRHRKKQGWRTGFPLLKETISLLKETKCLLREQETHLTELQMHLNEQEMHLNELKTDFMEQKM